MNQEVRSPGSGGAGWMSKDDRPQPSQNLNTKKQLTDISLLTWKECPTTVEMCDSGSIVYSRQVSLVKRVASATVAEKH